MPRTADQNLRALTAFAVQAVRCLDRDDPRGARALLLGALASLPLAGKRNLAVDLRRRHHEQLISALLRDPDAPRPPVEPGVWRHQQA